MTDAPDLCPGCFQEARDGDACRRCGYLHDPGAFPTALPPGTRLSKYTLGRVLGRPGGFGITYLSFDPVLHRRVAIKELMPRELVARKPDGATVQVHTRADGEMFKYTLSSFLNEARLLAQFSHPNVVRVLDYFEANGTAYFAMEYYEGQTLAEHVRASGGSLPGPEAVSLLLPVLDALEHMHSLPEPILHRDIKPANIYLTGRQTPILLDFGAARVAMGQQSRSLSAVLTPGYAPYEQYSTRGKQGPWSDVYACAATLHYLVTGRVPPEASERIESPQIEPPRALAPALTRELSDAIVYGLGFRPEERPQSARAFADAITGRAPVPLPAIEPVRGFAPVGAQDAAGVPGTLGDSAATFAPSGAAAVPAEQIPPTVVRDVRPHVPPPLPQGATQTSRVPNRTPVLAGVAAVLLVVATAWAAGLFGGTATPDGLPSREGVAAPDPSPPAPPDTESTPGPPIEPTTAAPPDAPPAAPVSAAANSGTIPAPATPPPADAPAGNAARDDAAEPPAPVAQEPQPAPAAPQTGVLVIIRGDDPDGVRQAESAILRAIVSRGGLQALDVDSLAMMRGDSSAVQAAVEGDFAALSALGGQEGVEVMVVGELRSRGTPSINRFFTGTAELSVRMYRVSTGRIVDTRTFVVGQGGSQAVLAVSEGEARSRAAAQVAGAAAQDIGSWLGR